jgi:predicted transcriptional regulator
MPFHRESAGLASVFGALELRVLEALWRRGGEVAVRDIKPEFPGAAYTTLMTTMDRLHRKGVLEAAEERHAFIYTPVSSREGRSGLMTRALRSSRVALRSRSCRSSWTKSVRTTAFSMSSSASSARSAASKEANDR